MCPIRVGHSYTISSGMRSSFSSALERARGSSCDSDSVLASSVLTGNSCDLGYSNEMINTHQCLIKRSSAMNDINSAVDLSILDKAKEAKMAI